MKNYFLYVLFVASTSCVNTPKYKVSEIRNNNYLYLYERNNKSEIIVTAHKLNIHYAKIEVPTDKNYLKIPYGVQTSKIYPNYVSNYVAAADDRGGYTYPPVDSVLVDKTAPFPNLTFRPMKEGYEKGGKFVFYEGSTVIQGITIPFKFRFPTSDPYEITTAVNAGVAIGYKMITKKYIPYFRVTKDGSGNVTKRALYNHKIGVNAWTPAGFIGLTTVALDTTNTDPQIATKRTVLGVNTGGMIVWTKNQFSIGASVGFDFAFGADGGNWKYQGKPWFGLVLGLDFIK